MIFKDNSEWKFNQETWAATEQTRERGVVCRLLMHQSQLKKGRGGGKKVNKTQLIQKVDGSLIWENEMLFQQPDWLSAL